MLDTIAPNAGRDLLPALPPKRGYFVIGLHQPKSIHNVGSVLRAAYCFDATMVVYTGQRYRKASTDTPKASLHRPLLRVDDLLGVTPHDCVPVAVDLVEGATPLDEFQHFPRSYYIFGPEDGTLPKAIVERCAQRVAIPSAMCLNLAAAVNVICYDRVAKERSHRRQKGLPL